MGLILPGEFLRNQDALVEPEGEPGMRKTAIPIIVLLVLQALWLETSRAGDPGRPEFNEEFAKQEEIYHSRGEQVPEGYVTGRSLLSYTLILSSEFDRALANLGSRDRWLDIGAGAGRAILDYYTSRYDLMHVEGRERRGKKASAVAISIEDRRTPAWHESAASLGAGKIQYFFGRRLREYSSEELGRFQVITDVLGGFSYSQNLSLFMEKVLAFLELGGSVFTLLQDVQSEKGTSPPYYAGSPFLTEIVNSSGSEVRVCSWLKSITCVEVACESKESLQPPLETYRIRKVCNDVVVPVLVPRHFQAGTPPERGFQLRNK